jgi:high-affinity Fe2+/Pb2+ permease
MEQVTLIAFLHFLHWASTQDWIAWTRYFPGSGSRVVYGGNWIDAWHTAQSVGGYVTDGF